MKTYFSPADAKDFSRAVMFIKDGDRFSSVLCKSALVLPRVSFLSNKKYKDLHIATKNRYIILESTAKEKSALKKQLISI
jgi:hypothetical protein